MSLEFIREAIKINQAISEDTTQVVVENDIIVPDTKPDIREVLYLDGDIVVSSAEAMQDRMLINGTIRYKVLYISDDEERSVKSIDTNAAFSCDLELLYARTGMKCKTKCDIEHIEYEILNSRKVNIKTIVKANGKVYDEIEQEIVSDLKGLEDIQILKENIDINSYIGSNEENSTIKETMEVPAGKPTIREILRNDIKIMGKDFKIADNKVIVKGELNISTLYIGDDERQSIETMEHEVPFTQFISLTGIDEDASVDVEYRIIDSRFEIAEDGDGELRVMNGEVDMNINVEGFSKQNIEIIEDAYSPSAKLDLQKENIVIEEPVCDNKSQVILKDKIQVNPGNPEIAEVFNVQCKPSLTDCQVLDDKVMIEGVMKNDVMYLSNNNEQPVSCLGQEAAFKHTIDLKGIKKDMKCEIVLDTEHCNYSMVSASEVEIRLVIGVGAKVMKQVKCPLLAKVTELPSESERPEDIPSIIIYFSQPGDTLWKIAKRYLITIDDIQRINNHIERDFIYPGQQIVIPKKI